MTSERRRHDSLGSASDHEWTRHPVAARVVGTSAIIAPAVAAVAGAIVVSLVVPRPADLEIVWWVAVVGTAVALFMALARIERHALSFAALLDMTLLFPCPAPSRLSVVFSAAHHQPGRPQPLDDALAGDTATKQAGVAVAGALAAFDQRTRRRAPVLQRLGLGAGAVTLSAIITSVVLAGPVTTTTSARPPRRSGGLPPGGSPPLSSPGPAAAGLPPVGAGALAPSVGTVSTPPQQAAPTGAHLLSVAAPGFALFSAATSGAGGSGAAGPGAAPASSVASISPEPDGDGGPLDIDANPVDDDAAAAVPSASSPSTPTAAPLQVPVLALAVAPRAAAPTLAVANRAAAVSLPSGSGNGGGTRLTAPAETPNQSNGSENGSTAEASSSPSSSTDG